MRSPSRAWTSNTSICMQNPQFTPSVGTSKQRLITTDALSRIRSISPIFHSVGLVTLDALIAINFGIVGNPELTIRTRRPQPLYGSQEGFVTSSNLNSAY